VCADNMITNNVTEIKCRNSVFPIKILVFRRILRQIIKVQIRVIFFIILIKNKVMNTWEKGGLAPSILNLDTRFYLLGNSHQYALYSWFFLLAQRPPVGQALFIHEISRSHTTKRHSWWDTYGRVISSPQRPLPNNTQPSQQTNILAPSGIRTNNLSRRAAADLRLKPRGHWDRLHRRLGGQKSRHI
jgi:hypothetical protein